eukprot:8198264-Pyramimonas_sp.AAC.1
MRPRSGQGVDRLSPFDVERLPSEGLDEWIHLLNTAEACLTWPWQLVLPIGRMLEQTSREIRNQSLVGMIPCIWSTSRQA